MNRDALMSGKKSRKVLAISSSGGHWVQLLRLKEALFDDYETIYVGTDIGMSTSVPGVCFYAVTDCNLGQKFRVIKCFFQLFRICLKERPDAIVSTGAAPGFIAIVIGKLFGAKTIWIDSLANTKQLSISGKYVGRFADLWLTQWESVASPEGERGPKFRGRVI